MAQVKVQWVEPGGGDVAAIERRKQGQEGHAVVRDTLVGNEKAFLPEVAQEISIVISVNPAKDVATAIAIKDDVINVGQPLRFRQAGQGHGALEPGLSQQRPSSFGFQRLDPTGSSNRGV